MKKIFVVSGVSGSGISTVMGIFEDLGFYCAERIPNELLKNFCDLIKTNKFPNIALSVNLEDLENTIKILNTTEEKIKVLLTVASNRTINNRYRLTKHVHPRILKNDSKTLEDAIKKERIFFDNLPQFENCTIINTDTYNQQDLKNILQSEFDENNKKKTLILKVFGYKTGIPTSCDLIIDTRSLKNPYWVQELRDKNGDDKEVYDYVINSKDSEEFLNKTIEYLDFMLSRYIKEKRNYIEIAVGCTGGQHRSLSVANYLKNYYKDKYNCILKYRE